MPAFFSHCLAGPDVDADTINPSDDASTSNDPKPCHLFQIPGELRNQIYEFVFHVEIDRNVDLLEADPPPEDKLLFVCRQMYAEAKVYHKEACDRYYKQNRYYIHDLNLKGCLHHHLRRISLKPYFAHLTLQTQGGSIYRWCPESRVWEVPMCWQRPPRGVFYVFVKRGFLISRPELSAWEAKDREEMGEYVRGELEEKGEVKMWRQIACIRDFYWRRGGWAGF